MGVTINEKRKRASREKVEGDGLTQTEERKMVEGKENVGGMEGEETERGIGRREKW